MAIINGTEGVDSLFGTGDNDEILALGGDDRLTASAGSDILNGGSGTDIADYSGLSENITLTPGGGVTKSGGGNDLLIGIETIVGNTNQVNAIDASSAGAGAGINVDLSTNSLQVLIPGLGIRNFTVENFSDIIGTNSDSRFVGNDRNNRITGGTGNDTIVGSKGSDTLNGGGGNNTVDYSNLGRAVKILPRGTIDKGIFGTDRINNFQRIIGAVGQNNTVDASTADAGSSLNVNLANNSLQVNVPGAGSLQFEVLNFVNAVGSKNNDTIVGGNKNSTLTGGGGNDTISGGSKNDRLTGTDSNARGVGEVDIITGGGGADKFILGDRRGAFYLGNGSNDYATITDFNLFQDSIDLGKLKSYSFALEGTNTVDLFAGTDVNTRDLIAKIQIGSFATTSSKGMSSARSMMGAESLMSSAGMGIDLISSQLNILSGDTSTADAII
jgi:Ca2+-binding RTX toxin-like protein